MKHAEKLGYALVLLTSAAPAFAGVSNNAPAPIAGVGVGAVALVGLGYRALKRRVKP